MSPSIISNYSKNLKAFPICETREKIQTGYLVSTDYSILRLTEWKLTKSDYDYCLTVSVLGGEDNGWLQEIAIDMHEQGNSEADIINYSRLLIGNESENDDNIQIARFVYNAFAFRSEKGNHTGIQIRGAFVHPAREQKGLARQVYGFLLNWHSHIVCDNHQTVFGARIWATGMILLGRVQIYDSAKQRFVDVLTEGGIGKRGIKPWDALFLKSEAQLRFWNPLSISIEPSNQILAVISSEDRYCQIGITTWCKASPESLRDARF